MVVSKSGLVVSERTVRWFELAVLVIAIGGPFASFYVSTTVASVHQDAINKSVASDIEQMRSDMEILQASVERKVDKIDQRLLNIEQTLNRIAGRLEK